MSGHSRGGPCLGQLRAPRGTLPRRRERMGPFRPHPPAVRETICSRRCLASTSTEHRKVRAPKVNGEEWERVAEKTRPGKLSCVARHDAARKFTPSEYSPGATCGIVKFRLESELAHRGQC